MSYMLIICGAALLGMAGYFTGGYRSPNWLSPSLLILGAVICSIGVYTP